MQKAKSCRLGQPCTPRTFKQLLACRTQHHHSLDAERIAELAELRKDRLYAFSNENDPSQIPLTAILKICSAIDNWDLLDFALEAYGRRSVHVGRSAARDLVRESLDLPVAIGRALEVVQRVTKDGVVDPEEAHEVHAHTRQVRRELDDVDQAVDFAARRAGAGA